MTKIPRVGITVREFKRVALHLANQAYVRYWMHWNYPVESPWLVAISVRDALGRDVEVKALAEWDRTDTGGIIKSMVYVAERRNEDGTSFRLRSEDKIL